MVIKHDIFFTKKEKQYISEILIEKNLKTNILQFDLNSKKKIILVKLKTNFKKTDYETVGAEFYNFIKNLSIKSIFIHLDCLDQTSLSSYFDHFLHGLKLKSYEGRP